MGWWSGGGGLFVCFRWPPGVCVCVNCEGVNQLPPWLFHYVIVIPIRIAGILCLSSRSLHFFAFSFLVFVSSYFHALSLLYPFIFSPSLLIFVSSSPLLRSILHSLPGFISDMMINDLVAVRLVPSLPPRFPRPVPARLGHSRPNPTRSAPFRPSLPDSV